MSGRERLIASVATNHCCITVLRPKCDGKTPAECTYVFEKDSPVNGLIRITASATSGGCLVTHSLEWQAKDNVREWAMHAFALRLTRVVAWIEVAIAVSALNAHMVASMQQPEDVEACRATLLSSAILPLDPHGVVAIKKDVRRFEVAASASDFCEALHRILSTQGHFPCFDITREPPSKELFKVGDRFKGVVNVNSLQQELQELRTPAGDPDLAARALLAIITRYLRAVPPVDCGVVRELRPEQRPVHVRYDYLTGTPIAGRSTFDVEDIAEGWCRVTQTLLYQEQSIATASLFGAVGLYIHNRVVEQEIEATALDLGVEFRALPLFDP